MINALGADDLVEQLLADADGRHRDRREREDAKRSATMGRLPDERDEQEDDSDPREHRGHERQNDEEAYGAHPRQRRTVSQSAASISERRPVGGPTRCSAS